MSRPNLPPPRLSPVSGSLDALQRTLGYRFRDKQLCELALTHRSSTSRPGTVTDNERLEFLGDSILGSVVARWLYEHHPAWSKGELTKTRSQLVSQSGLVKVGESLKLRAHIRVGHSQGLDPIPDSVMAGTMEALLGAILLDGNFTSADKVIRRLWAPSMRAIKHGRGVVDYKSQLQEWCIQYWKVLPHYSVLSEQGPAHALEFEMQVKIKGHVYGRARGRNKKEAEQQAARMAWQHLKHEQRKTTEAAGETAASA